MVDSPSAAVPAAHAAGLRRAWRALAAMLVALLGAEVLAALGIQRAPHVFFTRLPENLFFCASVAGALPLLFALRLTRRLSVGVLGAGAALAGLGCLWMGKLDGSPILLGPGLAALAVLGWVSARGAPEVRTHARLRLLESVMLAGFMPTSLFFLGLTTTLHPSTFDGATYVAELAYGFMPAPATVRLFGDASWLATTCNAVYVLLPLTFASITALRARGGIHRGVSPLMAFLAVAVGGYALYMLFPVVGPVDAFGDAYRQGSLSAADVLEHPALFVRSLAPRNCMPSLHTAWALVAFWCTRGLGRWPRAFFGVFFLLTELATLGLGYHYTVDLVVALPFTLAALAAFTRVAPEARVLRRNLVLGCAALVLGWLALLRFAPQALLVSPVIPWLATALTVAFAVWGERRLGRSPQLEDAAPEAAGALAPVALNRETWAIGAMFFLSGFAGLCYEVIFAKSLGLAFGSTSRASTLVLATYMGGIALGSYLGGRLGSRVKNAVRAYALVEMGVAIWCALSPLLLSLGHELYVRIAHGTHPASAALIPLQGGVAALLLLPPTLLMGMSTPFLTRHLTDAKQTLGRAVGLLYGLNTLGAALGAVLTGYLLLPALGVAQATQLAVALNLFAALAGLRLGKHIQSQPAPQAATAEADTPAVSQAQALGASPRVLGWVGLVLLTVGGFVTFALETTYIHMLAVVAGNSAYAFSLMVFAFLVGLSFGAGLGRRWLSEPGKVLARLGMLELLLAATLLAGVFLWNAVPGYFGSFAGYPVTQDFATREFIRFVVCCLAMVPPAFIIGAIYPLAMECVGAGRPEARVRAMGRASALNTLGNILGAIAGGFFLVNHLGSLRSTHLIAALCMGLALVPLLASRSWRAPAPALAGALALGLLVVQPSTLDLNSLSTGANVYFAEQRWGNVVDHLESVEGGLTTIAESRDEDGGRVLTMLTNGKFQGDDSKHREMTDQIAFSLVPLLHVPDRGSAAVIGLGTGVSARVSSDAGFQHLDVVELSSDIVHMARKHFGSVNGGVLDRPNVETHVTDGRNFLLLSPKRYDFIGMEISSIWFAGAANLYNQEFYEIARASLSERGVLQQWIQLHRLSQADVLSVIATLRSVFPNVWLYIVGKQGVMVACEWDCGPSAETLALVDETPSLQQVRGLLKAKSTDLLGTRVLSPDAVNKLLGAAGAAGLPFEELISTDDNHLLEYRTPRGNTRPYRESIMENIGFLRQFRPESLYEGTKLTAPSISQGAQP